MFTRIKALTAALCLALGFSASQPATAADGPKVKFTTNLGTFTVALDPERAPKTVANFLTYVKSGFYDGTIFHRVMPGFMIQGGGFVPGMRQKETRDPIQNEADNGLRNRAGAIAMARTSDPHSASAQFFINTVDNAFLDHTAKTARGWGYAVFGRVVDGMRTVRIIERSATGNAGPHQNVPTSDVVILKAEVLP